MSLFNGDFSSSQPRRGLTTEEIEQIFTALVNSEAERLESQGLIWDGHARGHVMWLIEQLREMVCPHLDSPA